jgi:hypothetical protein
MSDLINQINDNESEITESQRQDLDNYKGIFFNEEEEGQEQFYECGAHFSFPEMLKKLENLQKEIKSYEEEKIKQKKKTVKLDLNNNKNKIEYN